MIITFDKPVNEAAHNMLIALGAVKIEDQKYSSEALIPKMELGNIVKVAEQQLHVKA